MNTESWLQAQYSVLGALLLWPGELLAKTLLETSPEDFSGPCRSVYEAMRTLSAGGETVDPVTVSNALNGRYDKFLMELMQIVPTRVGFEDYLRICKEQARVSAVRELAQEMVDTESAQELRQLAEKISGRLLDRPGLAITDMNEGLRRFYARQDEKAEYLSWPIGELNERLYAKGGSFVVVGGTPSTGKSAWALQCAAHLAKGHRVGFFSLETDRDILMDRLLAALPELSMDEIKKHKVTERGFASLSAASGAITSLKLDLIPASGMTAADIRSVTAMRGYEVIIIDYLQLILGTGSTRAEEVAKISMSLHTMAQSMGVTVIALSQLKRKGEASSPSMSDLRESGQIEQDADIVMILQLENENDPAGPRGLYIAKNKEGTCFKIRLDFDGSHQTFSRADKTGETVRKMKKVAKDAQRARQDGQQMSMLPQSTWVPFQEGAQA